MSRMNRNHPASGTLARARQAAAQVKPAAAHAQTLAASAGAAARRSVHKTRAWAAPQVDRTGQVLQDRVAPKVSAALSAAARRLEPAKPKRRPWRKVAVSSALTTAASAAAAIVLNRRKPQAATPADEADADKATPTATTRDGQARTSSEADADGRVHTS
jgi:YD repeat-containing protein